MSDIAWKPIHTFLLDEVLKTKKIGYLEVGTPVEKIKLLLGEPELPQTKLNRKSKIWAWLYGNVSLLISEDQIININIDFHGNRVEMVKTGTLENWLFEEWEEYAKNNDWFLTQICSNYKIEGDGIVIGLASNGIIEMLSLG